MQRIDSALFANGAKFYVAQLTISIEEIESVWGPADTSEDDLAEWLTFTFELQSGTKVALVREMHNAPHPGYILTAIGGDAPRDVVSQFLTEAGLDFGVVSHRGFDEGGRS